MRKLMLYIFLINCNAIYSQQIFYNSESNDSLNYNEIELVYRDYKENYSNKQICQIIQPIIQIEFKKNVFFQNIYVVTEHIHSDILFYKYPYCYCIIDSNIIYIYTEHNNNNTDTVWIEQILSKTEIIQHFDYIDVLSFSDNSLIIKKSLFISYESAIIKYSVTSGKIRTKKRTLLNPFSSSIEPKYYKIK